MAELFTSQYFVLWVVLLAGLLFLPVRQLIWVVTVRRVERRTGEETDEAERLRLKRRAGVTAALLCFVFSALYVMSLFKDSP